MAISIPIISEFDGKGIDKAKKEFSELEGAGAKAAFGIRKAALPAAAALAGLGAALVGAVKSAAEDAGSQKQLERAVKNNTKATDSQIASLEDWITAQGKALGVSDDELRPALATLVRQTGDVDEAMAGASLAMDIAAATGKPLETVANSLSKAYGGNLTALSKLSPEMRGMIKDGLDLDGAMAHLSGTFGGAATDAALTAEGGYKRMALAVSETKESIGAALLPAVEKVMPLILSFAQWAQDNPNIFLTIGGAIAGIAVAILAINTAMALNPIALIAGAVIGVGAAAVIAYQKFDKFRDIVDKAWSLIKTLFGGAKWWVENVTIPAVKTLIDVFRSVFNGIATIWNNTIGKLSFKIPDWVPGIGGKGFEVPDIPMLAQGGVVTGPTLAMIGEAGPEAVIPLDKMGSMGGVTINVQGGDPNAVVDALRKYVRQNGSLGWIA